MIPRTVHDDPHHLRNYTDLRDWQDDITVLRNPHKGWYWHYIDNGIGRGAYRDQTEPGDWLEDFPGLNHLYLRFDWGDIEKTEGVYDWSYIDKIIEEWGARDYRFSFRLCTYEGSSMGDLKYATPSWVYGAGAKYRDIGGMLEPDYGDPVYLDKLENFMRVYGEKYGRHPAVEFVDAGTFGTWGEGHTFMGSGLSFPLEVMYKHIDLHAKNFPEKYVLLNEDYFNTRADRPEEENLALMEYGLQMGTGLRDDSICVDHYCKNYGYDTMRTPSLFGRFAAQAPVDIEFEHYHMVMDKPENWQDGFRFVDALSKTQPTYAGFHGYPRPWLEKNLYLTRYVANRLGYWYFIEGASIPELTAGAKNYITVVLSNRGYARCYYKYDLKIKMTNTATGAEITQAATDVDNRRWSPGEPVLERFTIDARQIPAGEYTVSAGLFEGGRAILFGMQPELFKNGFYTLAKTRVKE